MPILDAATKAELTKLYRAADRHYHGLRHIEALLALLEEHRQAFADPEAVEAAIWFHDAIYDSRRKDNEPASAELAADRLSGHVDDTRLARIVAMIEATATHQVPEFGDVAAQKDAALFLDMDLSILGAPAEAFDAYEAAVRREYGWVSDADWRVGRAAVLSNFLARPRIFHTDILARRFEARARANMQRSLEALEA
ncbi:HD domain-containing protein [Aminobacter sp. Piv2-1]|uniref:HD domain-containing protein n=1 Tax=Aminobacter sp. Piv2-1 TaxID=3031122 RepID=UPI0030B3F38C